jgi:EAL domain-containing protein (putative c-di-GMP-specific phosphodiesterase class I)
MPLQHLVDYFNQRFTEENGLNEPPLSYDGWRVEGRFGALTFTSRLQPVRLNTSLSFVAGHDAAPLVAARSGSDDDDTRLLFTDEVPNVVSLDRLSRTVHMLNYLPIAHDEGTLFLHVHPRHVLAVKRDHGAYFEGIIQRCGLSLRRVAITLTVSPVFGRQLLLLLERLKSYRDRGYATAIKFDDRAGDELLERYCIEFLYRFAPDFVRFDCLFFHKSPRNAVDERRRASLLSAIRRLDTQLLLEGVKSERDAQLARILATDFVQGNYYEQPGFHEPTTRAAVGIG